MNRNDLMRPALALVMLFVLAATSGLSAAAPERVLSVRDTPGYKPLVDPESSSVRLGRRVNAPLVSMPFKDGEKSLDLLAKRVLRHLHRTDRDSLMALCVSDSEFRVILWPEFPQSRPATGIQWDDAWKILWARMHAGVAHALRDYGTHKFVYVSVKADSVARYKNFTLYSGVHIQSRDDGGGVTDMVWLRAVAARKGRFKIYSTED